MPEDAVSLYKLYSPVLYGFILQFTTNESLACSILEESIGSILDKRSEWNNSGMSPITFMERITREKAIDVLKKDKYNGNGTAPSTKFLQVANQLSSMHEDVFYRRYYNGIDEKDIASELKISESEVKQKIRETVRALRDHFYSGIYSI